jgi:hypothetical protein
MNQFLLGLLVVMSTALTVSSAEVSFHGFGFDTVTSDPHDSQNVEVLAYQYGQSGATGTVRPSRYDDPKKIQVYGGTSAYNYLETGDSLYVKWRLKNNHSMVYEKTIDLKGLLPANMEDQIIYFVIQNENIKVFLITNQERLPDEEIVGPRKFRTHRVEQKYSSSETKCAMRMTPHNSRIH